MTSSYRELKALLPPSGSRTGITIGALHPPEAAAAAAAAAAAVQHHELELPNSRDDRLLLESCSQSQLELGAFLCLRCHISHPLEQKIRDLHRRFAVEYGLDLIELAGYALDDDGRTLNFQDLSALPTANIAPFTAQVICSYDASRGAGLPHWARTRLQAHNGLKAYLLEHGLVLNSDWTLLADSSQLRVRHSWEAFGAGSITTQQVLVLHANYCSHYRQARLRSGALGLVAAPGARGLQPPR